MNLSDHIFQLVSKNRLAEAMNALRDGMPPGGPLEQAVAQSGRFTDLMQRIHAGTVTAEQAEVEKNKIRLAILNLAGLVDEVVAERPELAPPPPAIGTQINQQHMGSGDNVGGDKVIHNG